MPIPSANCTHKFTVARILSAEQILALFFDHVFQQHPAQLRNRTLVIPNAEETVNITKLVKLISRPPLNLVSAQSTAQQQLTNRMRARMALLQGVL